jgi:hypothetical protein
MPTPKRGFRIADTTWEQVETKLARMRKAGYAITAVDVVRQEFDRFAGESTEETAARLGLTKAA